jgi:hypothetical protein
MTYLIIDPQTYIREDRYKTYETVTAAKISLRAKQKKAKKAYDKFVAEHGDLAFKSNWFNQTDVRVEVINRSIIITEDEFEKKEPIVIRKCLRTGDTYAEKLNTPPCLSRASNAHWDS